MTIALIAIIPDEVVNVDAVRLALLNQFRKTGREITGKYKQTTSTWKNKPVFTTKVSLRRGGSGGIVVGTDDEKYHYIDAGTKIRWAVMSSDWRSKTRRRRLRSSGGSGNVVIAGRRAMQQRNIKPRPGIEAREFSEMIAEQTQKKWPKDVQDAINKGLKKARG